MYMTDAKSLVIHSPGDNWLDVQQRAELGSVTRDCVISVGMYASLTNPFQILAETSTYRQRYLMTLTYVPRCPTCLFGYIVAPYEPRPLPYLTPRRTTPLTVWKLAIRVSAIEYPNNLEGFVLLTPSRIGFNIIRI